MQDVLAYERSAREPFSDTLEHMIEKGRKKHAFVMRPIRMDKVNFPKEVPISDDTVEVQSVVGAKGGNVSINYRVIKKDGGWKVYDVVIEGVSLINNYRTQFRDILSNNPPETLLDTLRKKTGGK